MAFFASIAVVLMAVILVRWGMMKWKYGSWALLIACLLLTVLFAWQLWEISSAHLTRRQLFVDGLELAVGITNPAAMASQLDPLLSWNGSGIKFAIDFYRVMSGGATRSYSAPVLPFIAGALSGWIIVGCCAFFLKRAVWIWIGAFGVCATLGFMLLLAGLAVIPDAYGRDSMKDTVRWLVDEYRTPERSANFKALVEDEIKIWRD